MSVAYPDRSPIDISLTAALDYIAHDLRVIPIGPGTKYPPVPGWQKAATLDPAIARSWWTGLYRGHGVSIVTGEQSGVWVLDVDTAGGKVGAETLSELEACYGPLPATVESITGSGGRHLFFAWDPAHPVRNDQSGRAGKDLDVRGEGGQVVAAPTVHPTTGVAYRWRDGHGFGDIAVAPAPGWLYAILEREPERPTVPSAAPVLTGEPDEGETPIEWFNVNVTWEQLLQRDGWTRLRDRGREQRWTRPGKSARDGCSVSINHYGNDLMWVGTTSMPQLEASRSINKFQYESRTHWGGDDRALASHVRRTLMPARERVERDDLSWAPPAGPASIFEEPASVQTPMPTAESEEDAWPEPEPLAVPLGHGQPFPLDTLPAFIADYCVVKAHALQCPVDTMAQAAIGALSVITLDKVRVHVDPDDDWWEDSNLYLVSVLPSGMSKSPAFKAVLGCLRTLQRGLVEEATRRIKEAEIEREIKEKQAKKLTEAASLPGADPNAMREAINVRMDLEALAVPFNPRFLGADVTMEKLADLFKLHGGRFALISTEGGIFKIMGGQYNERGNAMLDVPLQAWSGDSLDQDRFSRDVGLDRVLLSMCLATQPRTIEQIGRNEEFRGSGLTARFMYSVPRTSIGKRDRRPARLRGLNRQQADRLRDAYEERILAAGKCLQHPGVQALRLELSREAHERYTDWDQRHEDALGAGRDLAHMAEWLMKARASVVRLAALLHLAEFMGADDASHVNRAPTEIGAPTMAKALRIGDYWVDHARQVHEVWESTSGGLVFAREIVEWAVEGGRSEFTMAEAHKDCIRLRHRNEKVGTVLAAIELLEELGWVRTPSEFPGRRGVASPAIALHPMAADLWTTSAAQLETYETSETPEGVEGSDLQIHGSEGEVVRQMSSEIRGVFKTSSSLGNPSGTVFDESLDPLLTAHLSHRSGEAPVGQSSPLSVTTAPAPPDDDDVEPAW